MDGRMQPSIVECARFPACAAMSRAADAIEVAIVEVFQDLRSRAPTPAERAEWIARVARGVPIRELRLALEASPERAAANDPLNQEIAAIQRTGLFDADWYGRCYPDVAAAGMT